MQRQGSESATALAPDHTIRLGTGYQLWRVVEAFVLKGGLAPPRQEIVGPWQQNLRLPGGAGRADRKVSSKRKAIGSADAALGTAEATGATHGK